MPISTISPIKLNKLSDVPVNQRISSAPLKENGKDIKTEIGSMNELNCIAKIIYATNIPKIKTQVRLLKLELNPADAPSS